MNPLPKQSWGEATDHQPIYFAHANGFPPTTYQPIIDALAEQRQVVSYLQRPLWQPTPDHHKLKSWDQLADDVIEFFEQNKLHNVVAVGHSLGAVTTFIAAQKRPDLIKALVMIEPVAFSHFFCGFIKLTPSAVRKHVPIIKKALNRKHQFQSLKAAFEFHRRPRVFKNINDDNLWHYVRAAFEKQPSGQFELIYPREWEAQIYATVAYFRNQLLTTKLPVLGLRGAHTETMTVNFWKKWQTNLNHQHIEFKDNGHLLPLESPELVIDALLPFVKQHL